MIIISRCKDNQNNKFLQQKFFQNDKRYLKLTIVSDTFLEKFNATKRSTLLRKRHKNIPSQL